MLNKKEIKINYVKSAEQMADIFTKPLAKQTFCILREKLGILNLPNEVGVLNFSLKYYFVF